MAASISLGGQFGPLLGRRAAWPARFVGLTALGLQAGRELAPRSPRLVMALMTAAFGTGQILGPIAAPASRRNGRATSSSPPLARLWC